MALTQQFIESVCSVCPLRNNLNWYSEKTPEDWSIELNIDKESIKKAGKENLLEKGVKVGLTTPPVGDQYSDRTACALRLPVVRAALLVRPQ